MKLGKKIGVVTAVSVVLWITLTLFLADTANSNGIGAPAAHTGSPANGKSCNTTNCHTGAPVLTNNSIMSSNIPVAGYTPGTTYTISATVSRPGHSELGFEISPQNAGGTILGTMSIISTTATQLINAGKYITHKAAGTAATGGSRTWSFMWTAPAANTGNVTFYGAFNLSNNNNAATGDTIMTSTMIVSENTGVGISEQDNSFATLSVYPNPASDQATLTVNLTDASILSIELYSINGAKVKELAPANMFAQGTHTVSLQLSDLEKGCYFVVVKNAEKASVQKLLIQ